MEPSPAAPLRAVVIYGPRSGDRDLRPFHRPGVEFLFGPEFLHKSPDIALIFGGDGTLHRYLPLLHQYQVPLLPVPAGRGNDFASALGFRSPRLSLAAWERFLRSPDSSRCIDLCEVIDAAGHHHLFCGVGGAGLSADANRRANRQPAWLGGTLGYLIAALRALALYRPLRMTLWFPEDDLPQLSGPITLVAMANTASFGGGMRIAPQARPDDGLLDLVVALPISRLRLLTLLPSLFSGTHLRAPLISHRPLRAVRLESRDPLDFYADGEFVCRTPLEVRLLPRSLRVAAPAP